MRHHDLYSVILRSIAIVLGFYWITSLVWILEYLGDDMIGKLIFQSLFQGLLIYLMLFETDFMIKLLIKIPDNEEVITRIDAKPLVTAGIILIGLYVIFYSFSDILFYLISDHKAFTSILGDDTFITENQFINSIITTVLGLAFLVFHETIAGWIFRPRGKNVQPENN